MMKTKKIRVLALALIAALIASIYAPVNSHAEYVGGNLNGQTGPLVVGTPINVHIDVDCTELIYMAFWSRSTSRADDFGDYSDVNGLSITGNSVNDPSDGHFTAQISGTPTTAGTIYLLIQDMGSFHQAVWTLTINPAGGAVVPGGGAVVTTGEAEKAPEVVTYVPPCEHKYEWQTITAATATADGEESYVCTNCGDVKERRGLSAMDVFDQETANKILKAGPGATVNIECKPWNTFGHAVKDAMTKRPDVTVKASFFSEGHKGIPLKVTLPAGSASLFDQNGYLGLCNAGTTLGYDQ